MARKRGTGGAGGKNRKPTMSESSRWLNNMTDPMATILKALKSLKQMEPWVVEIDEMEVKRDMQEFPIFGRMEPFSSRLPPTYHLHLKAHEPPPGMLQELIHANRGYRLMAYFMLKPVPVVIQPESIKTSTPKRKRRATTARARGTRKPRKKSGNRRTRR